MTNNNTSDSDKYKKTRFINIRCTPELLNRLRAKADKKNESLSELALEYIEMGMKGNRRHDKEKAAIMVKQQQVLNDIVSALPDEAEELRNALIEYEKGNIELWQI